MSGSVDTVKSESGMVENMGVEVGIAAPSLTVQKLFPLPVWLPAILIFGSLSSSTNVDQRRRTSGSVPSVKSKSSVVENVGTAFGIALHTTTVQELFPFPVSVAAILNFGSRQRRPVSTVSYSSRALSKI